MILLNQNHTNHSAENNRKTSNTNNTAHTKIVLPGPPLILNTSFGRPQILQCYVLAVAASLQFLGSACSPTSLAAVLAVLLKHQDPKFCKRRATQLTHSNLALAIVGFRIMSNP